MTAPGADFTEPVVEVGRQTLTNAVGLTGTIEPVASFEVTAPETGTVVYFAMPSGRGVDDEQPLMTVRTTTEREPLVETDDEGVTTTTPQSPLVVDHTVYASGAGEVTFDIELNEEVTEGDVIARIDPGESYVAATVPPESLYRLLELPDSVEVTISNGPAPFACADPELVTATGEEGAGTQLQCDVPDDVRVFPGLEVSVSVVTATVEEALVVPFTSLRGTVEAGSVWVVGDDGEPVETAVALGINDGKVVEVTEGLSEGDPILQFVPGTPADYPDGQDGMMDDGSGEIDDGSGEEGSVEEDGAEVTDDGAEG